MSKEILYIAIIKVVRKTPDNPKLLHPSKIHTTHAKTHLVRAKSEYEVKEKLQAFYTSKDESLGYIHTVNVVDIEPEIE